MKFTVPGEPVGKQRPRVVRRNGFAQAYTPEKTVNYEALVKLAFQQSFPGFTPYERDTPLEIRVTAKFAPPASVSKRRRAMMLSGEVMPTKSPDIDNCCKIIMDALHGVCYLNDASVVKITGAKVYADTPGVEVEITTIDKEGNP